MSAYTKMQHIFDLPVEYKGLVFYPVKLKDYFEFSFLADCLMLEKNSITDPVQAMKAISMTYFQYLVHVTDKENMLLLKFDGLLRLVLNKKTEKFDIHYDADTDGRPIFSIGGITYNSSDFDVIRELIAEQNYMELPNEKIQKTVRQKLDEAMKLKQVTASYKLATLEEQIIALSMYSGLSFEAIYQMSIRKFFMSIRRTNHMIMSNIYLTASMSGFVKFKDKSIQKGWLADLDGDKYADVKIDPDDVRDKVNFKTAQEKNM